MNKFISYNTFFKTKPYITTIFSIIFIFIPYFLIWILFGEGRYILFIQNNIDLNINIYWYNELTFSYSWEFYLVFFLFLLIPIVLFIFCKFIFKIFEWDIIPFLFLTCGFWIGTLITGLFPVPKDDFLVNLIIIGKIIFIIFFSLLFFFIFNLLTNFFIINSKNISSFFNDFKNEEETSNEIRESQKAILEKNKIKKDKETTWEI